MTQQATRIHHGATRMLQGAAWMLQGAIAGVVLAAMAAERPRITGIAEVTFFAKDVAAARTFYTRLLGYEERSPGRFAVSDRQSIRIIPEKEAGSDRLVSVALATDNAAGLRSWLESKGVAAGALARDPAGNPMFAVTDPDSHTVQFVERRERRSSPRGTPVSTNLRHAGILVGSLSASIKFYTDVLGFKETWRGSRDGITLDWVNLQVPDGDDYIELMLYRDLPAADRRGTQHHVCLFLDNLESAVEVLKTRIGITGYGRGLEIRTGVNRKRQLNLFDPDGTRVELMEPRTIDGTPTPSSSAPPPRQ